MSWSGNEQCKQTVWRDLNVSIHLSLQCINPNLVVARSALYVKFSLGEGTDGLTIPTVRQTGQAAVSRFWVASVVLCRHWVRSPGFDLAGLVSRAGSWSGESGG